MILEKFGGQNMCRGGKKGRATTVLLRGVSQVVGELGTRIALCILGSCERYSRKRVYTHHRDRGAHVCNRPSRANFGCWYCLPCVEQREKKKSKQHHDG